MPARDPSAKASGIVADHAELARPRCVTRARISQIMSLLNLAADFQEFLLFLHRVEQGKDPVTERELRAATAALNWTKQRKMLPTALNSHFS